MEAIKNSIGISTALGISHSKQLTVEARNFIQDVMRDEGIASMDDLGNETITEILEGILG